MWQNGETTLSALKLMQDTMYITKSTGDEEIATKEWVENKLTGIETLLANI